MSVSGTVVDCAALAATFPRILTPDIQRDALLNSVEDLLSSDLTLIALEGRGDTGKTRTLAQFVKRHGQNCISLFVRRDSWYFQDPSLFYGDFIAQASWLLNHDEHSLSANIDESSLRSLFFDLQKHAKIDNRLIYVVIDGLDTLEDGAAQFIESVSRILPTEFSQFRFIVSGDGEWIPRSAVASAHRKSLLITGFSLMETGLFLYDLGLTQNQIESIYKICGRGNPGQLASDLPPEISTSRNWSSLVI